MKLKIKRKDWEAHDGRLVEGSVLDIELLSPSEVEVNKAKRKGFPHLVDGTFIWYKHIDKKKDSVYYLGVETIESVWTPSGDMELFLKHEGEGCFGVYYA